jgi:dolichol-phosphate mannosyltransferase
MPDPHRGPTATPPAPPRPHLTLVVPVYDEADNLRPLYGEIVAALAAGPEFELIFVDDGSRDASPAVLATLAAADPRVRLLRSRRNAGQSAALAAGARAARGAVTVTLDADLQNDPADIPLLLAALDEDCDVVCGVRQKRRDSWVRLLSSRIANGVRNRLTHESIADVGCTLRACRTVYLLRIPWFDGMHRFLPTLLRQAGARIREVPVRHRPRLAGKSKYGIGNRLWRGIKDLLAVRWMQQRWIDPSLVEEHTPCPPPPSGSPSAS